MLNRSHRARIAVLANRLRPLSRVVANLVPLPSIALDAHIRIELRPPNGRTLRPSLVRHTGRLARLRPTARTAVLAARVIAEQRRAGLDPSATVELVSSLFRSASLASDDRATGIVRLVDELVDDGDLTLAQRCSDAATTWTDERGALVIAHALACRRYDHRSAVPMLSQLDAGASDDQLAEAAARHRAAFGFPPTNALANGSQESTIADIRSLLEATILQGKIDDASELVEQNLHSAHRDLGLLRLCRFVLDQHGTGQSQRLIDAVSSDTALTASSRIRSFNELLRPDLAVASLPVSRIPDLNAHGVYGLCQAHYAMRDFEAALSLLRLLRGSVRHADANKLTSRILFEQGDVDRARAHRERHAVPSLQVDEVLLHCRLSDGAYAMAFGQYCPPGDAMRAEMLFGAQRGATVREQQRLFVAAQSGPGDEIQMAMAYNAAAHVASSVECTVDPRLLALFNRSFPAIRFLPTRRRSQDLTWGFLEDPTAPRLDGPLGRLLDQRAGAAIERSDCLVFSRELPAALGLLDVPPRSTAFLCPDPDRSPSRAIDFDAPLPLVGVVWRSEMRSVMRSIHYLEPSDLEPVLALEVNVVCLQHDATGEERAWLEARLGDRVAFVDDVDLRDDLDGAASLLAQLDVVVGVGTTLIELAPALGTSTVLLQPNHFGTWRAVDGDLNDFWYASCRVAARLDHRLTSDFLSTAARLVSRIVET